MAGVNNVSGYSSTTSPTQVKYTNGEMEKIDSIFNSDGKVTVCEHLAFTEYADKNKDGVVTDEEKKAALNKLESKKEAKKLKSLKTTYKNMFKEYLATDEKYGTNDDLKVGLDEFVKQFGENAGKVADQDGDGKIGKYEYIAFTRTYDKDNDGKLSDSEIKTMKDKVNDTAGQKTAVTSNYNLFKSHRASYTPSISGVLIDDKGVDINKDDKLDLYENLAFKNIADTNGDGIVSDLEKADAQQKLGYDKETQDKLAKEYAKIQNANNTLSSMDSTKDSSTSKEEFVSYYTSTLGATEASKLAEVIDSVLGTDGKIDNNEMIAFTQYADKNSDGILSKTELTDALKKLNNSDRTSKREERYKLFEIHRKNKHVTNDAYNTFGQLYKKNNGV